MKELRPYQKEAITALWQSYVQYPHGKPLIVVPTGAGKSLIISEACRVILKAKPRFRIFIVSHRKEIISQNAKEIYELLNIPVGIYSAGLGSKTIHRITCANIQSIWKKDVEADVVIIDEAHLLSPKADSMYQKFLSKLRNAKVFGLTATPMRLDQGSLVGEGTLFTDICYNTSLAGLIADGFLSPLISKRSESQVDFSNIRKSGYDYNQGELESLMFPLAAKHAEEIKARTGDRKHVLVFCSGVKHAEEMARALGGDFVTGEMLPLERDRMLRNFSEGRTRYLCNCEVLTTGYNFPGIDCIVLLRATQSAALYIQAVGRGSRTAEGKANTLVLDFGGNISRHGPIDLIEIKDRKKKKMGLKVMPHKTCSCCGAVVAIRTTICPSCETPFPAASCKLEEKPEERDIMSGPQVFEVADHAIRVHKKGGKPPSLRLQYTSGSDEVSEFLCFEHGGFASHMAEKKWFFYGGVKPAPRTTEEAFKRQSELITPAKLEVIKQGKYYRVVKIAEVKQRQSIEEELEQTGGWNI